MVKREHERLRILDLVDTGRISVDEAVSLLAAVQTPHRPSVAAVRPGRPWRLIVRLRDGTRSIRFWLPLAVITTGLWLAQRLVKHQYLRALPVRELRRALAQAGRGPVIDIDDGSEAVYLELA